jgi:hypothetical protein
MKMSDAVHASRGELFPSREGQGQPGPGVGFELGKGTTPALRDRCRCAPPLRGGDFSAETGLSHLPERPESAAASGYVELDLVEELGLA